MEVKGFASKSFRIKAAGQANYLAYGAGAVLNFESRIIRQIEYHHGLCIQEEHRMISGYRYKIGLCKSFRIITA